MIQDKTKLYPIGTVVELENFDRLFMIAGYFRTDENGVLYDYSAFSYPVGNAGPRSLLLFNANTIRSVVIEGYRDELFDSYAARIDEVKAKIYDYVADNDRAIKPILE